MKRHHKGMVLKVCALATISDILLRKSQEMHFELHPAGISLSGWTRFCKGLSKILRSAILGGFHSHGGTPTNGWFISRTINPNLKLGWWLGDPPFQVNPLYIYIYPRISWWLPEVRRRSSTPLPQLGEAGRHGAGAAVGLQVVPGGEQLDRCLGPLTGDTF